MLSLTAPPAEATAAGEATVVLLVLGEEDCPMIPVPVVLAGREVHNREEVLMLDNNNNDDDKIDRAPTYLLLLLLFLALVPYSKALLRRIVVPNSPSEWC